MWHEIIEPFPNINVCTIEVWKWINNFHLKAYDEYNYLSMLRLKLSRVSQMNPRYYYAHSLSFADLGIYRHRSGSLYWWLGQMVNCMMTPSTIKWKHFPRYWSFVRGIHRLSVDSLTKASDVDLWCFLWSAPETNGWANNGDAGDLRRHRAHYDVTVLCTIMRAIMPVKQGWLATSKDKAQ